MSSEGDNELTAFTVDKDGPVARVTVTGRAMGPGFFRELPDLFAGLDDDPEVRAIVLTGDHGRFSYGLDLPAMATMLQPLTERPGAGERQRFMRDLQVMQDALTAVAECRTPVVAAVSGWCIGGGVDLIACADVRVASADATFSVREVRMAIVADLGSLQRLVGIVGDGHLRELALTGDDVSAERAAEIGLVNHVVPSPEEALERAHAIAARIAQNSPLVTRGVKDVLEEERADRVARGLRYVAAWNSAFLPSNDLGEAMRSFLERRPPRYTGD